MRGFLVTITLSVILCVFSGCATGTKKQSPVITPLPEESVQQPQQAVKIERPVIVEKTETTPPSAGIMTDFPAIKTEGGWVSVDSLTNLSCVVNYNRTSTPKRCVLQSGSRSAEIIEGRQFIIYKGIRVDLGYLPQWMNGSFYLNTVDISATVLPLLKQSCNATRETSVIVLDPGHGGSDPGATSVISKKPEKDYTLDVAKRAQAILTDRGWKVILTRTNDARIERASRVAFAQKAGATVFVSIHFNYFEESGTVSGVETYCLTPRGLPSSFNRGFNDDISVSFSNNNHNAGNIALAAAVHSAFIRKTGAADRGVRHARFLEILQNQNCPAILVEAGFLSSIKEAQLIESAQYRQLIAGAIAAGIEDFCNGE